MSPGRRGVNGVPDTARAPTTGFRLNGSLAGARLPWSSVRQQGVARGVAMVRTSSNGYFFVFAGNAIRPPEALGARLVERRPAPSGSQGRGGGVATWLFVGVAAISSLVLGIV